MQYYGVYFHEMEENNLWGDDWGVTLVTTDDVDQKGWTKEHWTCHLKLVAVVDYYLRWQLCAALNRKQKMPQHSQSIGHGESSHGLEDQTEEANESKTTSPTPPINTTRAA
jgi:hypothetical protein